MRHTAASSGLPADHAGGEWTILTDLDPAFPNDDIIHDFAEDPDGRMWVATGRGALVVRLIGDESP